MKSHIFGQIRYNDVPDTRALRSFTDKQIKNWIQKNLLRTTLPKEENPTSLKEEDFEENFPVKRRDSVHHLVPVRRITATYLAVVSREPAGRTFDCHVEVHFGNQTWVGDNYEVNIHKALLLCLHHMSLMMSQHSVNQHRH